MTKNCSKCQRELPFERFRVHKRDGIIAQCKDCERAGMKAWRKTPKGRAFKAKHQAKWKASPAGRESEKRSQKKWRESGGQEKNNQWKVDNPDAVRSYFTKYNHSEKGKAARERFEHKKRMVRALTMIALDALK